jgi:hypothetical protein
LKIEEKKGGKRAEGRQENAGTGIFCQSSLDLISAARTLEVQNHMVVPRGMVQRIGNIPRLLIANSKF